MFGNETITDIAKAHGKTSAQIILRWHLQAGYVTIPGSQNPDHILENYSIFDFEQAGYVTIPGSQNPDHILENYSIFDFELTDAEMQRMAELHTGHRYENW